MDTVKQSTETLISCILLDDSDFKTPELTIAAGSVTITYCKEGGSSWSAKTAIGNWDEIGKGVYDITWSTTDLNTLGTFKFVVECTGCLNYYGAVRVVAKRVDDLNDIDADDVWDEPKAGHTTADTFGDYLDDEITSRSSHTANNVRDAILSDSTPFDGADIDAAISSRSSHSAADVAALLNDPTVGEIADAVWDELTSPHVTVGSFAKLITDNLDAAISGIATAADNADAVWDELKAAHTTANSFGDFLDIEVSGRSSHSAADVVALMNDPTVGEIADGVWDELYSPHVTVGSFAELITDNLDAAVSSRSSHAAADVVALMNDVTANEVRDAILADSTPFDGADIAAIVTAIAGLNDLAVTDILSDSTAFAGGNIDAAITSRSSHTAANVDTQLSGTHGAGSWEGGGAAPTVEEIVDGVWDELKSAHTTPDTFGDYLDTEVSGAGALTVQDIVDGVWNELKSAHTTADSFGDYLDDEITSRSSHSAADVQALLNDLAQSDILNDATPFAGGDIDAAVSSRSSHTAINVRDAILSDSTPFDGADIDAAITSRSSHSAADVDTTLSASHGAGSWEGGAAAPTVGQIADAVWNESRTGHIGAGTFGLYLDAQVTTRSSHAAADVVALMNDLDAAEILAAITSDSTKFAGGDIDAAVSSRSSHSAADVQALLNDLAVTDILSDSTAFAGADVALIKSAIAALNDISAADVDTTLSASHGAGNWEGGGAAPTVAEIWGEAQAGYSTPGTFGFYLDAAITSVGGGSAPSAAAIAEEVHNVKRYFDKTTGVEIIKLADDSTISTRTITDTETTVQKE